MTDATDQRIRLLCDPAYHPARVKDLDPVQAGIDVAQPTQPEAETILSRLRSLSDRVQRLERLIGDNTPDTAP